MARYARQRVVDVITEVASPYIGQSVAAAAGPFHCRRLKIDGDELDGDELEAVLASLSKSLRVFVGNAKAEEAVNAIRSEVEGGR